MTKDLRAALYVIPDGFRVRLKGDIMGKITLCEDRLIFERRDELTVTRRGSFPSAYPKCKEE